MYDMTRRYVQLVFIDQPAVVFIFQVDHIPNMVTSVAFGLGGDVITGDSSGRIFVWNKDSSDAFVVDKTSSENMRYAHEVSVTRTL